MHNIILIGPIRAGKSTLGRLLAEKLRKPQVSMDQLRWQYYREIGYDEDLAQNFRRLGGFLALVLYWQQFDPYAVERLLAEHQNCVVDFGAGGCIVENDEGLARIQHALDPCPNVILLLPSTDLDESMEILAARDLNPPKDLNFDFNRHFVEREIYHKLAKHIVYTKGKSPTESCEEIMKLLS